MDNILKNVPNWLTFLRLALIPLFAVLMDSSSAGIRAAAAVVFVLAAITDYVDGFLARRWGAVSDFGKLLDPLADKILVMTALVMLVGQRSDLTGQPWVPAWMVVLVLAREIWVTGLRAVAATRGRVVPANHSGKLKSGLQMVAIVFLLLHEMPVMYFADKLITSEILGSNILLVSLAASYWGAYEYTTEILLPEEESDGGDPDSPSPDNIH